MNTAPGTPLKLGATGVHETIAAAPLDEARNLATEASSGGNPR